MMVKQKSLTGNVFIESKPRRQDKEMAAICGLSMVVNLSAAKADYH